VAATDAEAIAEICRVAGDEFYEPPEEKRTTESTEYTGGRERKNGTRMNAD
jgi:hypothetical protein